MNDSNMEARFQQLNSNLHTELQRIEDASDNLLQQARHSFEACCKTMDALKAYVLTCCFRDTDEEIRFFKEWKPAIHKALLYWKETVQLELGKARSAERGIPTYIRKLQVYYCGFLHQYRFLVDYHSFGRTDMDGRLFVRGRSSEYLPYGVDFLENPACDCAASTILAHILAYTELIRELGRSISEKGTAIRQGKCQASPLRWTGSKAQFIEFAYGIHASGAVNGGNAEIRQVFTALSICFGIEVSSYYSYFNAMVLRKKGKTPFFRHVTEQLLLRMEEHTER